MYMNLKLDFKIFTVAGKKAQEIRHFPCILLSPL